MTRDDVSDHISVIDPSAAGECRRRIDALGERTGVPALVRAEAGIAATEAATNIVTHARSGDIFLRSIRATDGGRGIELIAYDRGPGISDLKRAMADGYSTRGTSGTGLGAIARLASDFRIRSRPDGTVLVARFLPGDPGGPPAPAPQFSVGALCEPQHGETACGDGWALAARSRRLLVIDGLGHGSGAAEATLAARGTFAATHRLPLQEQLAAIHAALARTRGAAVALAQVGEESVDFIGVGNIAASVTGRERRVGLVSGRGIVGQSLGRPQVVSAPMVDGALLVMHSDGLRERWSMDDYPGLWLHDPAVVAATLFRDFRRERDDATIVVVRNRRPDSEEGAP